MRYVKPFLVALSGFLAVTIGISLLLPSRVMTSKWVMVHGDTGVALSELRRLQEWPAWNGLLASAGKVEAVLPGGNSARGGHLSWSSAGGGMNRVDITEDNERGIACRMRLQGGKPMESGFSVEGRTADSTQVVWFVIEDLQWYPWEKFYGMMAADVKGPLMQQSLERLKARLEAGRRSP